MRLTRRIYCITRGAGSGCWGGSCRPGRPCRPGCCRFSGSSGGQAGSPILGLPDDVALEPDGLSPLVGGEVKPELIVLCKGLRPQALFESFAVAAVVSLCVVADAPVQADEVFLTVVPSIDIEVGALDVESGVGLDSELAPASVAIKQNLTRI